jgi:NAD(P)H-flavin reductase
MLEVEAPEVARKARAGQFIILRVDDGGERIPLTVFDVDRERGTVKIVFLEVGTSTRKLGRVAVNEKVRNFVGPLGKPSEIKKFGQVVCISGGIGAPAIYPIAKALREAGNRVISIVGARTANLLILEDEIRRVSDEVYLTTDDGSKGQKGLVTNVLRQLIDGGVHIDRVIAVGPAVMMKAVSDLTRVHKIETVVSLNPIMVDGTGMCGCCRVTVGGKTKFACVDGPEFNGHEVDFDNLISRLKSYQREERQSMELFQRRCGG